MIGRISERRDFERLSRHGRRARTDALWCRYLDDAEALPPRIAFAIGRPVGGAVTRNRMRRRLRELVRAAVVAEPPRLSRGRLLIGAQPHAAELSFAALAEHVDQLLAAISRPVAVRP